MLVRPKNFHPPSAEVVCADVALEVESGDIELDDGSESRNGIGIGEAIDALEVFLEGMNVVDWGHLAVPVAARGSTAG